MNGILTKIVDSKRKEVADLMLSVPFEGIKRDSRLARIPLSMKDAILKGSGLIAEFKRASPSKGIIRESADPVSITGGYQRSGASAISVLTDREFFKAQINDIELARGSVSLPILRKDFIVDPYQIYQAKLMGADCILLIAAILSPSELRNLLTIATDLGMEAIIEVHNSAELNKLTGREELIGVNNRNLDTFVVDIQTSIEMASLLTGVTKITESGLDLTTDLKELINAGFDGFLVGEGFMKEDDSAKACENFVNHIKRARS